VTNNASAPETAGELRAGVVGLGMIGAAVATNLAAAGFSPTVFDVREDAYTQVPGVESQAKTPLEVAEASDVVLIAVVNAEQARDVLIGENGLLTGEVRGLTIVLLSTVSVPAVKELAALCAEHDATLLDAGVTQAGGNKLVVMLGGPPEAADAIEPVLRTFTRAIVHCGPLGAGMVAKLARNAMTYGHWAVVREAVSLAVAGGVEPARLLEVMKAASDGGPTPDLQLRLQVEQGGLSPEVVAHTTALSQKDLAAAQEFAGANNLETPIIDAVRPRMKDTIAGNYGTPLPDDRWDRGLAMIQRVYGDQLPDFVRDDAVPFVTDTVENLFGTVWARGNLSMRDRRLLALGATTMLGRQDLLETQLRGALGNGEFTLAQLREMEYFLNYYTSVENGSAVIAVIEKLVAEGAVS